MVLNVISKVFYPKSFDPEHACIWCIQNDTRIYVVKSGRINCCLCWCWKAGSQTARFICICSSNCFDMNLKPVLGVQYEQHEVLWTKERSTFSQPLQSKVACAPYQNGKSSTPDRARLTGEQCVIIGDSLSALLAACVCMRVLPCALVCVCMHTFDMAFSLFEYT